MCSCACVHTHSCVYEFVGVYVNSQRSLHKLGFHPPKLSTRAGIAPFVCKGTDLEYLSFAGPMIYVGMTHLCYCSTEAAIGRRHRPKRMSKTMSQQHFLSKKGSSQICPASPSLAIPELIAKIAPCLFLKFHFLFVAYVEMHPQPLLPWSPVRKDWPS